MNRYNVMIEYTSRVRNVLSLDADDEDAAKSIVMENINVEDLNDFQIVSVELDSQKVLPFAPTTKVMQ